MEYAESILELIGNTPLVRLTQVTRDLGPVDSQPKILAKLELLNPGGSVKDRIGLPMIEAAERDGLLKPGGTIIEPTSGNTGHGLAIAAALKGYRCIFVMADKQSVEKQSLLRAYGAEVVLCPTNVPPESPESYYSVAARLARDIPGAFKPDQYWNQNNPEAHYRTTGPEIWRQTEGRITHLVVATGTGGTVTGTGRYLREQKPDIVIVGGDPEGSVLSGDTARPYLTEGIGEDFFPGTYDQTIVNKWVRVSDRDAFAAARRITREEGILAGESCGTALIAALTTARDLMAADPAAAREAVIVVIFPDGGRNYLSKLYNDEWMRINGLLGSSTRGARGVAGAAQRPSAGGDAVRCPGPDHGSRRARQSTSSSFTASASCRCRKRPTATSSKRSSAQSARRGCSSGHIATRQSWSGRSARSWTSRCRRSTARRRSTTPSRCFRAARRRSSWSTVGAPPVSSPSSTCSSTWHTTRPAIDGARGTRTIAPIKTARLSLESMSAAYLKALLLEDVDAATREIDAITPMWLAKEMKHFALYRLGQLTADPSLQVWLGRGMVLVDEEGQRRVVGSIGFHGPPDEERRLEIGYSVDPPYRRRGFAREAAKAMYEWAYENHGITTFVASVAPDNEPSLILIAEFGYEKIGEQMDEVDGLEYVFEMTWPQVT